MTTKITKLKLDNVGGFKDFELDFHDKLTVLIGNNGSGKTTILSSIALLLDLGLGINLEKNPNNNFLANNENQLHFANQKFSNYKLLNNSPNINVDLYIYNNKFLLERKNLDINGLDTFKKLIDQLFMERQYLPLFVYYPTYNAPIGNVKFSEIELENNIFAAYISACSEGVFDFNRFFNWFRWQESIKREIENNKKYEIVRQAIYQVLNDDKNTFDNLHITWLKNPQGDLCIEKNGTDLNINQLSAGEKMLLILVADLARRLIVANPESENPLHGDGVILIDEIDLHLHPSWQRKIVPCLMEIFPNCQFIISTHSPLILGTIQHESVTILDNFQPIKITPHTLGRDNNSILYDLMGVTKRPEKIQKQLDKFYELLDEDKKEEAQNILDDLSKDLGEDDTTIVKARVDLDFADF
ncbi:AAA family ATPase [Candidatus Halobeggiatoa sp. HSG11]|nr:AAA family ATPase [Candidatus Halobeggiatoa sp. HSG11]